MNVPERSLTRYSIWLYHALAHAARVLGWGLVTLARMWIGSLIDALTWPWRRRAPFTLGLAVGPWPPTQAMLAVIPPRSEPTSAPAAPHKPVSLHSEGRTPDVSAEAPTVRFERVPVDTPLATATPSSPPLTRPEIDCIDVEPSFHEADYPHLLQRLQLGRRSKLLDLRAAKLVKIDLFDYLASAWCATPGTVPRLGILLNYESWVVYRNVADRRLRPLAGKHGVEVEIFYAQQADSLDTWFAEGQVSYDQTPAIVEWLRTQWRPTAIWSEVLSTTAMLVHASAEVDQVPELLLELAAIALTFEGAEAAEESAKHASAALTWTRDRPSPARCRALRSLAAATFRRGDNVAALAHLETAVSTAASIKDPIEEASALFEIGAHALRCRNFARAEARFRTAILTLTGLADGAPYLRATLHHDLALALHEQRKDDEAERHATLALELRWNQDSQRAEEDRALLVRIRARRR